MPVSRKSPAPAAAAPTGAVYGNIVAAIVDQRLPPGTWLNELAMCQLFKVSRRELERDFSRLVFEGLVTRVANRGAFVASPDAQEARAIFAARKAIEAGIVELAAARASGADFKLLERCIADEEAHRHAGRMREAVRASGEFHRLLSVMAGNPILEDQVRQLIARTSLVTSLFDNASEMGCWHDDHAKLVGHLRARRTKRAIDLMRMHLDALEESLDLDKKAGSKSDLRAIFGAPAA